MKVQDIMTENPACCTPDAGLQEVASMMVDCDCGCIPVVDNEDSKMPVGMITDRDITCRVVAQGKNPFELAARDAMTSTVLSVRADTSLEECLTMMEEGKVRRVAVVDEKGAVCGIVAQADIATNAGDRATAEVVQEVSRAGATG